MVARDPDSGQLGVAVATAVLAVGRSVPWARAGVGVIASQAFLNRAFGPAGLHLLGAGHPPAEVVRQLLHADPDRADRQLAVLSAVGEPAAWTGGGCIPACGDVSGPGFSAQGNTLVSRSVVPTIAGAFTASTGPLAERLLTALQAGDQAGGDIRGRQSAALLVVGPGRDDAADPVEIDLRVDDHPEPLADLERLLLILRAHESGDWEHLQRSAYGGLRELYSALAAARRGEIDQARSALTQLRREPGWDTLLRRLRAKGRLDHAGELLD